MERTAVCACFQNFEIDNQMFCHTKLNLGIFNMIDYYKVCKYIPIPPKPVIMKKVKKHVVEEGIPPIPKRLFQSSDNNTT